MLFDVKNLTFLYENGKSERQRVLNDLSVSIKKGSFTGILGPNGCGKTTFLDLLVRHLTPEKGEILFEGKELDAYSSKEYAQAVALVSQNFYINFSYTVEEIVMMGRHPYIPRFSSPSATDFQIAEKAMEKADIVRFRDKYVTQLSGGERQRVVFARALAQDTPVLVLDEATSNLDINHTLSLMSLVAESVTKGNRTVISVFQDINLASMYCDRLILLNKGEVLAAGRTEDIFTSENIQKVFNVESRIFDEPFSNSRFVAFKR